MLVQRVVAAAFFIFVMSAVFLAGSSPSSIASDADFTVVSPSGNTTNTGNILLDEENIPPTVHFIEPLTNDAFALGAPLTMSCDAEDEDGVIDHVHYYNAMFNQDSNVGPHYVVETEPGVLTGDVGDHYLNVVAFDDEGAWGADSIIYGVIGADLDYLVNYNILPEEQEEDLGAFIPLSYDAQVNDMLSIYHPGCYFNGQIYPNGSSTLSKTENGTGRLKLWGSADCQNEVTLPKTAPNGAGQHYYDLQSYPYIEGTAVSNALRDITLTLTYTLDGTTCTDTLKATIVQVNMPEIVIPMCGSSIIVPTVTPTAATNFILPGLAYESENEYIATVSIVNGNVTVNGTGQGHTRILAKMNGETYGYCDVYVFTEEIHPISSDFQENKVGRILLSIWKDGDQFYAPAQTGDGTVKITYKATLPGHADKLVGWPIYFRVLDPDDCSPYETDTLPGDNEPYEEISKDGTITPSLELQEVDDDTCQVENTFEITPNRAGNNYIVQATSEGDGLGNGMFYDWSIQTVTLVAWKKVYVEYDQMYKKGATITVDYEDDQTNNDSVLNVDDTADFTADPTTGTQVIIFNHDVNNILRRVKSKTATTITVSHINTDIPKWSGVRLQNDIDKYELSFDYVTQAFGDDPIHPYTGDKTSGIDGGAFVEFEIGVSGSEGIPLYKSLSEEPLNNDIADYCLFWFNQEQPNTIQVCAMNDTNGDTLGITHRNSLLSACVFTKNIPLIDYDIILREVVAHEIGHPFGLRKEQFLNHVDVSIDIDNHDDSDNCLMTYPPDGNDHTNGITEFDTICIYHIRYTAEPLL